MPKGKEQQDANVWIHLWAKHRASTWKQHNASGGPESLARSTIMLVFCNASQDFLEVEKHI